MSTTMIQCKGCGATREPSPSSCCAGECTICEEVGWVEIDARRLSSPARRFSRWLSQPRAALV